MKLSIDLIRIQNRIRKDYGNIEALSLDIAKNGLIQPIVITPDNILITGERRIIAVKKLGWSEIDAIVMTIRDYEHQLNCEISENECRKDFTPLEHHEFGQRLEQIEKLKAEEREKSGKKITLETIDSRVNKPQTSEAIAPDVTKGKTDDIVGSKIGISGKTYQRLKRVVESGDNSLIQQMNKGEIGIATAYKKLKSKEDKPNKQADKSKIKQKEEIKEKPSVPQTESVQENNSINSIVLELIDSVNKILDEICVYPFHPDEFTNLNESDKQIALREVSRVEDWSIRMKRLIMEGISYDKEFN